MSYMSKQIADLRELGIDNPRFGPLQLPGISVLEIYEMYHQERWIPVAFHPPEVPHVACDDCGACTWCTQQPLREYGVFLEWNHDTHEPLDLPHVECHGNSSWRRTFPGA